MSTFAQAVQTQEDRTENGMKAFAGTGDACVDLFSKIGSLRNGDPIPYFIAAFAENQELALRVLQWARDVRGGAGERNVFRKILAYLDKRDPASARKILRKIPEIGRWDDIFILTNKELRAEAFTMLGDALRAQNGLAAKWTPRKGPIANELRAFFGMTPKQYRKSLVALTNVVEQQMCAKKWDDINFSHVPSVAASRYKKAFLRNAPVGYKSYIDALVKGDPSVKVNASAIFPHDVLKDILQHGAVHGKPQEILNVITAQWNALPNYVEDHPVLALVDVSGSMNQTAGSGTNVTCHQVALSLGLYVADKNKGPFKDTFLTFSREPQLLHLKGDIVQKLEQMNRSKWDMNTDIIAALDKILSVAKSGSVADADMPKTLLIMSDMQFDQCARFDDTAFQAVKRRFRDAGYSVPNVVFWNLNARSNSPAKADDRGVALVSGFSPAILGQLLGSTDDFTPMGMMLQVVMVDRYALD